MVKEWAWKPAESDKPKQAIAKAKKKPTKKSKVSKRQSRQKIDRKKLAEKRQELLWHFKLHKYATWTAIADMIAQEKSVPLPSTVAGCKAIAMSYRIQKKSGQSQSFKKKPTSDNSFYRSSAWLELRYIALRQSEGKCTLCGASAKDGVQVHIDHIVPRSIDRSKELDIENLQALCSDCNIGKSNRDSIDWRYEREC